jgi:molecular chaperone HscB
MSERDHFERLGLPRRFALDAAELERHYLDRSRAVHPDHVGDAELDESARLNEAYATLKDPWKRADYLVRLLNGPSAAAVTRPPMEFLEEMLDLRMAIAEAKGHDDQCRALEENLNQRRSSMLADLGTELDRLVAEPLGDPRLTGVREHLNAVKFINGLLRDLRED